MTDISTFMMSDKEVRELGRVCLHGPLPQTTVMRLFNAAIRLLDEKDNLEEKLETSEAECVSLTKDRDTAIRRRDAAKKKLKEQAEDNAHADRKAARCIVDLRAERDEAVTKLEEERTRNAR